MISEDDVLRGFNGWKERMSTSPSGRHLGHYKAIIQHPRLLKCFVQLMNIVVPRSIAIPRWCQATNVMIEEDVGSPRIHQLRMIHLFEVNYNFFLQLQWDHCLVRQAVLFDLFHNSQHGSIPQTMATIDPIMLTQLTSDLCRILNMILPALITTRRHAMTGYSCTWNVSGRVMRNAKQRYQNKQMRLNLCNTQ